MRRRDFIIAVGGTAITWPIGVGAQQALLRFGYLGSGSASSGAVLLNAFRQGLRENNLVEGKDYALDARWAEGQYERFPGFARELVAKDPAALIITTIAGARAAQQATKTIPIIMASINDPVGNGIVQSLARPGGNTTGMATLNQDVTPKLIELLPVLVPKAVLIAVLLNPQNPSNPIYLNSIRSAAGAVNVTVRSFELRAQSDLQSVFDAVVAQKPDALLIVPDASTLDLSDRIAALSLEHHIPVLSTAPELTAAGGLASYGVSRWENYRRAAYFIRKILNGASPGDLPVEQPTKIVMSINLKTAQALGIRVPDSILIRADEVIE